MEYKEKKHVIRMTNSDLKVQECIIFKKQQSMIYHELDRL